MLVKLGQSSFDYVLAPEANPFAVLHDILSALSEHPDYPSARQRLLPGLPRLAGRPRLVDDIWYDVLLEFLALTGIRAHPRVQNSLNFAGGEFSVPAAWSYITRRTAEFDKQHPDLAPRRVPALKSLYRYFAPLRPTSRQGKTHHSGPDGHSLLWIRPVLLLEMAKTFSSRINTGVTAFSIPPSDLAITW